MISKAIFSKDKKYRYVLERNWDNTKSSVLFIGLNPSTADEFENDPTIRRLIGFAERWGYGGLYVCNLFGFRTPYPKELFKVKKPVGPRNDYYIKKIQKKAAKTILIYGNHGEKLNRHLDIQKLVKDPYCVQISKRKMPMHPLYLKYTERPIKYTDFR